MDPVVVIDSKGKFLRSWGKGTMSIPHSIRLDPADNVWIGDAHTSMFYKFTPEGKKLMESASVTFRIRTDPGMSA